MPVGYGLISLPWWWQAQSGPFHHFMAHWPRRAHCPACAGNAKVTNRTKIIDAVLILNILNLLRKVWIIGM